jgi:hypothetical protein
MKLNMLFAALLVSVMASGCCFTGNCPGEVEAANTGGDLMAIEDAAARAEAAAAEADTAAERAEALFHRGMQK